MKNRISLALLTATLFACAGGVTSDPSQDYEEVSATTVLDSPSAELSEVAPENRMAVERGEYMVELLGCATCHTNGALIGEPDIDNSLGGSDVGIAYESPLLNGNPGIIFPPNITSDIETGIGGWSEAQLDAAIRQGTGRHSTRRGVAMPWPGYARLSDEDTNAIILYLKNTKPIKHRVPARVRAGQPTDEAFVYFGFYRED